MKKNVSTYTTYKQQFRLSAKIQNSIPVNCCKIGLAGNATIRHRCDTL